MTVMVMVTKEENRNKRERVFSFSSVFLSLECKWENKWGKKSRVASSSLRGAAFLLVDRAASRSSLARALYFLSLLSLFPAFDLCAQLLHLAGGVSHRAGQSCRKGVLGGERILHVVDVVDSDGKKKKKAKRKKGERRF